MKTKLLLISIILGFSAMVSAQEQQINNYLDSAALNNPQLKYKFNEYLAALEKIPQLGSLPNPLLAFGYFIQPVETRQGPQQFSIAASQFFPWFGTLNSKEEIAANFAKAKYESFEEAKSKLFYEVKTAYYTLYFISKSIDITKDNIKILNTFKNLALIKIEAGKYTGVNELRVEMELEDFKNSLLLLEDKLIVNTVKFNKLLNTNSNAEITIPKQLVNKNLAFSYQQIIDSLRINNHQIKIIDHVRDAYKSQEIYANNAGKPGFAVGVNYINIGGIENNTQSGNDALLANIGISIPLYRKKYNALVKEATILQQVNLDKKMDKMNRLESLAEKVYKEYEDAERRINLYKKQINLATNALKILESDFASTGNNFEEILRMERNVLKYKLQLEKAYSDKQKSIAYINYIVGK